MTTVRKPENECNLVEYLNLSNFITSNVNDMSYMCNKCKK